MTPRITHATYRKASRSLFLFPETTTTAVPRTNRTPQECSSTRWRKFQNLKCGWKFSNFETRSKNATWPLSTYAKTTKDWPSSWTNAKKRNRSQLGFTRSWARMRQCYFTIRTTCCSFLIGSINPRKIKPSHHTKCTYPAIRSPRVSSCTLIPTKMKINSSCWSTQSTGWTSIWAGSSSNGVPPSNKMKNLTRTVLTCKNILR